MSVAWIIDYMSTGSVNEVADTAANTSKVSYVLVDEVAERPRESGRVYGVNHTVFEIFVQYSCAFIAGGRRVFKRDRTGKNHDERPAATA